jgi:glycerol-1-phosphate dehydrogenase [NAD(P)+]
VIFSTIYSDNMDIQKILNSPAFSCECGKIHKAQLKEAIIENGAIQKLPEIIKKYNGTKVFLVADENTMKAAGNSCSEILNQNNIPYKTSILGAERAEPDEHLIGKLAFDFSPDCDIILGIGTGIINDLCKILANITDRTFILVATAPSMDGFASSTSSIIKNGLKVSINSRCADCLVADVDILKNTPYDMILAGFGDMLAKYISICEWRIGNIVTGEYYCEYVANMMRTALKAIIENADGLKNRDDKAIISLIKGLILSGIAADYAGVSRPASGVEHYYSHIWDMRHLEFNTPWSLHGIQCGVGTCLALKEYEKIKNITPDKNLALASFEKYDIAKTKKIISEHLGKSGNEIVEKLETSDLFNREKHKEHLKNILTHWDKILEIISEELPCRNELILLMNKLKAPTKSSYFGIPDSENHQTFLITKYIRDKYILSTLYKELGLSDF